VVTMGAFLGALTPEIRIVDVGAMWLDEQPPFYGRLLGRPGVTVVGFEPVEAEREKLERMGRAGHTFLPYVVGDGSEREFIENNYAMTSSLYDANRALVDRFNNLGEAMVAVKRTRVTTRRLDDIAEVGRMDLLKMDIQGAEVDALRGATRLLREASAVHLEVSFVPMYLGQPLFAEVDQELRRQGFLFHTFTDIQGRALKPVVPNQDPNQRLNQMLWGDAVYLKDFTRFGELSPEHLLRVAMVTHDMLTSFDFTALALQHYDARKQTRLWWDYIKRLTGNPSPVPPPPL
jgi:FkbM family methyltransferase